MGEQPGHIMCQNDRKGCNNPLLTGMYYMCPPRWGNNMDPQKPHRLPDNDLHLNKKVCGGCRNMHGDLKRPFVRCHRLPSDSSPALLSVQDIGINTELSTDASQSGMCLRCKAHGCWGLVLP